MLEVADNVLTPEAIDELLVPLLDTIFSRGQTTLGIVGVVIAIWAGSRVVDALVNAMTIVYQREGLRSFVHTKLLSLGVYVAGLGVLIVAIPLILAGPTFLTRIVPGAQGGGLAVAADRRPGPGRPAPGRLAVPLGGPAPHRRGSPTSRVP